MDDCVDRKLPPAPAPVQANSTPSTSLSDSIKEIEQCPWYWGAITPREAERLLADKPIGTFLIRDSASDNYIFALSYRTSVEKIIHSRIPRHNNKYCLGGPQAMVSSPSIVDLVNQIMDSSKDPERRILMHPSENIPMAESVILVKPLNRIEYLPSLKYLCRLVIRQTLNDVYQIQTLPLPEKIKRYLSSKKYLIVHYSEWEENERRRKEREREEEEATNKRKI